MLESTGFCLFIALSFTSYSCSWRKKGNTTNASVVEPFLKHIFQLPEPTNERSEGV